MTASQLAMILVPLGIAGVMGVWKLAKIHADTRVLREQGKGTRHSVDLMRDDVKEISSSIKDHGERLVVIESRRL